MRIKSRPLYPFQSRVIRHIAGRPRVGLFVFYGGGKTYLALEWLNSLSNPWPCLILCPKSLITQWCQEIEKHSDFDAVPVIGTQHQRQQKLYEVHQIYVTNYDIVRSQVLYQILQQKKFRTVIADESTYLKSARTVRFKKLRRITKTPYRAILTGMPVVERPEDLWSQMLFLDDGKTLGTSFMRFRFTYFQQGPPWRPYEWLPKPGAVQQILNKIKPQCICVKRDEIIDELPKRQYVPVYFDLPNEIRQQYNQLKSQFKLELEEGTIDTKWAVTRTQKLHQICQGFVYLEDKHYSILHGLKLEWLLENLPLLPKPLLIWCTYRAEVERIQHLLESNNIPAAYYTGPNKQDALEDFQQGRKDIMVLTLATGSAGLNLQRAVTAIFCSNSYKASERYNAESRIYRIGSTHPVLYVDLIIKHSVDEVIKEALERKEEIANAVLDYLQTSD